MQVALDSELTAEVPLHVTNAASVVMSQPKGMVS
jgi:hypothetical protein